MMLTNKLWLNMPAHAWHVCLREAHTDACMGKHSKMTSVMPKYSHEIHTDAN